jgi:hypothetical protein
MAQAFRHAKYFRVRNIEDSSLMTFSSVSEAKTAMALNSAYDTNSPTRTETLEESGTVLKIIFEFNSAADQAGQKSAVDAIWSNDTWPFGIVTPDSSGAVEHFKTEWYGTNGSSIESTANFGNLRK